VQERAGWHNCTSVAAELVESLQRLDTLLERAISTADQVYGAETAADRFRGLYIGRGDAERLIARTPGVPLLHESDSPDSRGGVGCDRLAQLQQLYSLTSVELDILLVALAVEVDLKYERLYAYLQDDVTKKRPSVDLVLNLLSNSIAAKLQNRALFSHDAPLLRHRLIQFSSDILTDTPLLSRPIRVNEQVTDLLLGGDVLDSGLAQFCHFVELDRVSDTPEIHAGLNELVELANTAGATGRPLRLYFHGEAGTGRKTTAAQLAARLGKPLLVMSVPDAVRADKDFGTIGCAVSRAAILSDALLYVTGVGSTQADSGAGSWERLWNDLDAIPQPLILSGENPWIAPAEGPYGVRVIHFGMPSPSIRQACWAFHLDKNGIDASAEHAQTVADRFKLRPSQIADAAASVRLSNLAGSGPLLAAARTQSGRMLESLARKIEPRYRWSDIVLPEDSITQLRELCSRARYQNVVLDEWGFDQRLSAGKGINALFAGPSGTGKTMAAEIVASELGYDLYQIDLSGIISKYIGETEKNLNRVFTAAENANAILFFDEADALFGKRSEVRDSHDRYANVEISYLLQKMEAHDGISILATNLRQNLDEAFVRRLAFTVHFPFPSEDERLRVWEGIWPSRTPLSNELNLRDIARRFKLSGGNIKNVALAAAFLAAEDTGEVGTHHILAAIRREYQKLSKPLSAEELALNGSQA